MTRFKQLEQMLVNHGGMLLTSQVIAEGISKPIFYDFVRKKDWIRQHIVFMCR